MKPNYLGLVRVMTDVYGRVGIVGMEGLAFAEDSDPLCTQRWVKVAYPGTDRVDVLPDTDLKPIKRFSKSFAKKYDIASFASEHCLCDVYPLSRRVA